MSPATTSTRRAPALLALLLVVAALAGCAQSPPPENPSQADYIYRADADEKAPHPASYQGGYGTLTLEGPTVEVPAEGAVEVLQGDPEGPVTFPADVEVHDARGRFVPDDGSAEPLDGETVHVRGPDDGFAVEGVASVSARHVVVEDGRVVARSLAGVDGNTTWNLSRQLTVGGAGATARNVSVAVGQDDQARNGTLHLEAGTYGVAGTPLGVDAAGSFQVPESAGTVTVEGAEANATLRGRERPVSGVTLEASRVTGSVDPEAGTADLEMGLYLWTDSRPRFEAHLEPAFRDGSTSKQVTLSPGENETYWTRARETGGVGSAEAVRPRVDEAGSGEAVDAGFGIYWYDDPDPSAMEQFLRAMVFPAKAFEALFQDPATKEFRPGEEAWIPFGVEVADDASAGTYTVEGWFHGENAKSQRLAVEVTVQGG